MSIEPKLEAIGYKILNKVDNKPQDEHGSIILIVMVISVVLSLIRVIQECNSKKLVLLNRPQQFQLMGESMKTIAMKRTLINQWRLKRILKNKLSPQDYRLYGQSLQRAIMDTGAHLTDDEISTLLEASNV
jgi:hypothetical protein